MLAAALKCDPDLIFEYVYNNIEYEPLFGSNKGPLGTLLDQRGSDLDQAQLLTALLVAAGFSSSQFAYEYGYLRLNGVQASGWLGVKNDGVAIARLLDNGGIPRLTAFINPNGTLNRVDVAHVWVRAQISGTMYVFDPSLKQHTIVQGLSNLGTVLGYSQSEFLTAAGGVIDSVSISNINRGNIRSNLTTYASNLVSYITSNNPAWTVNDVIGGKTIQYLTGSPRRQTVHPNLAPAQPSGFPQNWGPTVPNAYRTCFTISMPGVAPTGCSAPSSQTIQLYSDETYGRCITIFSIPNGSNFIPTLLIEGAAPPNGQNTGTALPSGQNWAVNVSITHPYVSTNFNQTKNLIIRSGGSYLISAGWGQVGRGMIQKHRTLLDKARAAGNGPDSEAVLGENLAVIGYTWLAELAAEQRIGDAIAKVTTQYHHGVGIVGQAKIQSTNVQGPYVDLPLNVLSLQAQTSVPGGGFGSAAIGRFFANGGASSSLESAVLEQTQSLVAGVQAASTVRLVDMNAATSAKTYFADGTTASGVQAYFTNIKPNLSGYSAADLQSIDCSISANCASGGQPGGLQVLLPANGNISVNLWHGAGYTIVAQSPTSLSITNKISGGLSGGYIGDPISAQQVELAIAFMLDTTAWSLDFIQMVAEAQHRPSVYQIFDPVDGITGAYIYQNTDLTTGGGSFPYALSFARNYTSSANTVDTGLGKGWSHNYGVSVALTSDPFSGLGANSPISAAAAIAAIYVAQDLMSGPTKNAQLMTATWLVNRWLTDQITNNSVAVTLPGSGEQFIQLPRLDGSSTGTYNPPPGSASVLTGSAPDQYGNFTAFTYRNKDQSLLTFNSLDPATMTGNIASWAFPKGMSLGFTYGYSFDNKNYLTVVSNNLGRRLTLSYSGAHVSSVTDDTGRSISYSYNASKNLVTFSNPLQQSTTFAYDATTNRLTQVFYPSNPGSAFVSNTYDVLGHVIQQADANGNSSSFYFAGSRTETIDPSGARHVTYQSPRGKVIKDARVLDSNAGSIFNDAVQQNGIVNVSTSQFDGQDRLVVSASPEGGTVAYVYSTDLKHNVVQVTQTPKPGSPLAPLVTAYTYDAVFNKPTSVTDPRGLVTTMTYDPWTGNLLSVTADAGSAPHFNAKAAFTYNGYGQILTSTDPMGTVTLNGYDNFGNNISTTRDYGTGRLNQVTTRSYSALGDVLSVTDPNSNFATSTHDMGRRLITVTSPSVPAAPNGVVTALTYDADGRVLQTQQSASDIPLRTTSATYTPSGKTATATDPNGNVTTYAYDTVDRLSSVTDAAGRVTSYAYDAVGRRTKVFNTAIQATPLVQQGYTANGAPASLTDAKNNTTSFAYDGFDRLATTSYPLGSTETFSYDADGNVLTRKTRANQTIAFTYDTLNRLSTKTPPAPAPMVSYAYDRGGPGCLNSFSASISGASAGFRPPCGVAAG
jgi:YD repeat-containing protein